MGFFQQTLLGKILQHACRASLWGLTLASLGGLQWCFVEYLSLSLSDTDQIQAKGSLDVLKISRLTFFVSSSELIRPQEARQLNPQSHVCQRIFLGEEANLYNLPSC